MIEASLTALALAIIDKAPAPVPVTMIDLTGAVKTHGGYTCAEACALLDRLLFFYVTGQRRPYPMCNAILKKCAGLLKKAAKGGALPSEQLDLSADDLTPDDEFTHVFRSAAVVGADPELKSLCCRFFDCCASEMFGRIA